MRIWYSVFNSPFIAVNIVEWNSTKFLLIDSVILNVYGIVFLNFRMFLNLVIPNLEHPIILLYFPDC